MGRVFFCGVALLALSCSPQAGPISSAVPPTSSGSADSQAAPVTTPPTSSGSADAKAAPVTTADAALGPGPSAPAAPPGNAPAEATTAEAAVRWSEATSDKPKDVVKRIGKALKLGDADAKKSKDVVYELGGCFILRTRTDKDGDKEKMLRVRERDCADLPGAIAELKKHCKDGMFETEVELAFNGSGFNKNVSRSCEKLTGGAPSGLTPAGCKLTMSRWRWNEDTPNEVTIERWEKGKKKGPKEILWEVSRRSATPSTDLEQSFPGLAKKVLEEMKVPKPIEQSKTEWSSQCE